MSDDISLADAKAQRDAWILASAALRDSQGYEINGRKLTRANLAEVLTMIDYWSKRVLLLSATSNSGMKLYRPG